MAQGGPGIPRDRCHLAWATGRRPVFPGADGNLLYSPDALGNRIEDFSDVGYLGAVPGRLSSRPRDEPRD